MRYIEVALMIQPGKDKSMVEQPGHMISALAIRRYGPSGDNPKLNYIMLDRDTQPLFTSSDVKALLEECWRD